MTRSHAAVSVRVYRLHREWWKFGFTHYPPKPQQIDGRPAASRRSVWVRLGRYEVRFLNG